MPSFVSRADPAWFECGATASQDYGRLFAQPAAGGATAYWFDRRQRLFAMACRKGPRLGEVAELHGRLFRVHDWTDPAKADLASLDRWRRLNREPEA